MNSFEIIVLIFGFFFGGIVLYIIVLALLLKLEKKQRPKLEEERQAKADRLTRAINNESQIFWSKLVTSKVYRIRVPRHNKWNPEKAVDFFKHILVLSEGRLIFRIVAENGTIAWEVIDYDHVWERPDEVIRAIHALYPESEVIVAPYRPPSTATPFRRDTVPIVLEKEFFFPIKFVGETKQNDPLVVFINSLSELKHNERLVYSIYIDRPIANTVREKAQKEIKRDRVKDFTVGMTLAIVTGALSGGRSVASYNPQGTGRTGQGKYHEQDQRVLEEKLYDCDLMDACIVIQKDYYEVKQEEELNSDLLGEITILAMQFTSHYNGLAPSPRLQNKEYRRRYISNWVDSPEREFATGSLSVIHNFHKNKLKNRNYPHYLISDKGRAILAPEELAILWHLPHEALSTNRAIKWVTGSQAPAKLIRNRKGIVIGVNQVAGATHSIRLPTIDRRTHMNIIGRTGVGKSTFMHNLIHQDIVAGRGVAVIDPHGELISNILRCSIPDNRVDDVCILDIANGDYPPPLNPLLAQSNDSYVTDSIISILDQIEQTGIPHQTADTLTAALVTLRYEDSPTVRDVTRLFENAEYRSQLLSRILYQVTDVTVHEFWHKFSMLGSNMHENLTRPVTHRIRKFYRNPMLHLMLCHPDRLNFSELINQQKIVLVSLGADLHHIPDREKQLVGTIIMSLIQSAGMSSLNRRNPFYLYVDEVQQLITSPLDKILAGARKYNLHLILANQYLGQLRGKTLDSVMGTVGATIVFQISEKDAVALAPYFRPQFQPEELVNLDLHKAATKVRFMGKTLPAFSVSTMPPPGDITSESVIRRERAIRNRSIQLYTPKSKKEVTDWLNKRYPPPSFISQTNDTQGIDWIDRTN